MYFVAGVTGRVGGAVARAMLKSGKTVRTLVRDPQKADSWSRQGVELRQGNLADVAAVRSALENVEGAFLMQPTPFGVTPQFPEANALNAALGEALAHAVVPRVVVLSSVGSEKASGLGNITQTHLLEQALAHIRSPLAIVRAGSFLENYVSSVQRAASTGILDSFLQPTQRPVPMVASEDIGREAARLLLLGWHGRPIIEIGSRFSPDDLAVALTLALGKAVSARAIPRESWTSTLRALGLAADTVGPWEEMQDGFNSGWIDFGQPDTVPVAATIQPVDVFRRALSDQARV
jgi:uncharacterized protein YbjT (DUF2867 family)